MFYLTDIPFEINTIPNLFAEKEIKEWVHFIEFPEYTFHRNFTEQPFHNGKIYKPELSTYIFSKIQSYLPIIYTDRNQISWEFVGPAPYIFYSKLVATNMFGIHTDTGSVYDEDKKEYSKFTLLIYLNDDFVGGETQFYSHLFEKTVSVIPKTNTTLFFDIDLYHQGNEILEGTKYWIGTELVCRRI